MPGGEHCEFEKGKLVLARNGDEERCTSKGITQPSSACLQFNSALKGGERGERTVKKRESRQILI